MSRFIDKAHFFLDNILDTLKSFSLQLNLHLDFILIVDVHTVTIRNFPLDGFLVLLLEVVFLEHSFDKLLIRFGYRHLFLILNGPLQIRYEF